MLFAISTYLLIAAAWDFIKMKIPNVLTLGVFPFLLAYRFYESSWQGLGDGLLAYFIVIAILFVPFSLRWMGGGDLKFLANIACIVGLSQILSCFFYGAILSLIHAGFILIKNFDRVKYFFYTKEKMSGDIKLPYTPAFAVGAIIYFWQEGLLSF